MLPEIIRGVLAEPPEIDFHAVAPRRTEFGREFRERAPMEGFDQTLDPHLAFDMLLGTAIVHLLANLRPMTDEDARAARGRRRGRHARRLGAGERNRGMTKARSSPSGPSDLPAGAPVGAPAP